MSPAPESSAPDWSALTAGGYQPEVDRDDDGRWMISLPHQCEEWMIAASTDKEFVIRETERFIALLRERVAALRSQP